MKRIAFVCAFLLTAAAAVAQNPYMAREGVFEQDGRVVVECPRTTLAIDLTVEKEVVLCGPYARYAQKYLGVRAPLTDKTTYSLTGASVALAGAPAEELQAPAQPAAEPVQRVWSHSRSETDFARLQPDKIAMTTLPLEDAAREAAATIFSLRKHRLELITGEAGEHVFGQGLAAALDEIERLEQGYLELFLGKRVTAVVSSRYRLTPKEGKTQYILCRFSADTGILPENDLSGDMVLLQIMPSGDTFCPYEAGRREVSVADYRIADPSECSVVYGNRVLAQVVLPIFEFGRTVHVAIPRKR